MLSFLNWESNDVAGWEEEAPSTIATFEANRLATISD